MSNRTASLLVLCLALSAGCSGAGTGPTSDARFFPLTAGNTWVYAPEDTVFGQPFEWRVIDRRGDTVEVARPPEGSHPGTVTLLDRSNQVDLLLANEEFAPFYEFTPGASWVHRDPWDCDDGATLVAVEETSPVVTPAGTFPHSLRIERRTTSFCDDAGTMTEWWAPGVGLVKWQELNFFAGAPVTFHLVSYSVD